MAPGGGSRRQSDDEQDGNGEQRPSYQRANSVDEVSGQAPAIVSTFFGECFRVDGLPVPQELSENQKRVNKEVAHVIRDIGDRLANDTTLNNLISQVVVSKDTAFDTFLQVGAQIFNDGRVNWGRKVTLFYFGYVALQVINQIPLIILGGKVGKVFNPVRHLFFNSIHCYHLMFVEFVVKKNKKKQQQKKNSTGIY